MFDIEPVTLVFSFVLFGAFTVPFIYHSRKNSQKESRIFQQLSESASKLNSSIDTKESWRYEYALGLDSQKGILYYFQSTEEKAPTPYRLQDFKKVYVTKKNLEFQSGSNTKSVLDKVSLELTPKDSKTSPVTLELYDGEKYSDLMGETLIADKWAELLKKHLN
ncbi:MAG: hypothetical protein LPK25_05000 [Cyclobacteriaceae bacterium]|nr:hypothetical protein [Cyclobacteriaceae bacterium]MDX5466113.1 hypothetical protein [Cyclobacteriaceae bacterium]